MPDIIGPIKSKGYVSIEQIAASHDIELNTENSLRTCQQIILAILKDTGPSIFDDNIQWNLYQNLLTALYLLTEESDDREIRLEDHTHSAGHAHYNPLHDTEIEKLDELTVEALAGRYNYNDILAEDWNENPCIAIQTHLSAALLELSNQHVPNGNYHAQSVLKTMAIIDHHYNTQTEVQVEDVDVTYEGIETTVEEVACRQRTD